jgi:hypothetical protein
MATSFYIQYPGIDATVTGSVDVDIHDSSGADITLGQKTMAQSLPVVIASDQSAVSVVTGGLTYADSARNLYSSTAVTTATWVQLIAATAAVAKGFYLFDSSGQTLELGFGAPAAETRKLIISPGGFDGLVNLAVPAGTRLSLRAISATASVGEIDVTLLG